MYLKDKFTGVWNLKQWVYVREGRPDSYPYGEDAAGMLLYSDQGMMSAILMKPDRSAESDEGYVSYSGRFSVNDKNVEHHVTLSLRPEWIGEVLIRAYEFRDQGNTLILTTDAALNAKGESAKNILTWTRDEH